MASVRRGRLWRPTLLIANNLVFIYCISNGTLTLCTVLEVPHNVGNLITTKKIVHANDINCSNIRWKSKIVNNHSLFTVKINLRSCLFHTALPYRINARASEFFLKYSFSRLNYHHSFSYTKCEENSGYLRNK